MTVSKLTMINRILDSAHEQRIQASTQPLGNIIMACVDLALTEVCSTANWADLRASAVATWSTNLATVAGTLEDFRVTAVKTQFTTTQMSFAGYVSQDEFDCRPLVAYGTGTSFPQYWTYNLSSNTVKCNPYPNDAGGIAKVFLDYQVVVTQPTLDTDLYSVPDRILKLVEMRASSLFCLKYIGELKLYQIYDLEYNKLRELLIGSEQGNNSYVSERQPQLFNPIESRLQQPE